MSEPPEEGQTSDASAGEPRPQAAEGPGGGAGQSPLEAIVDDTPPNRAPAIEWAANELINERTFEAVAADLVSQGWPAEAADAIVEEAREATRRERGVKTREDVLRNAERRYQRSMRYVRLMIIVGIALMFIIIMRFFKF